MIIGIDGGGSKTEILVSDLNGKKFYQDITGPLHYKQIGFAGVLSLLNNQFSEIFKTLNIDFHQIQYITIGLPGFGEIADDSDTLHTSIAQIIHCDFEIVNDVKLGWAGALLCQPGICIIAGTGSMAYAVDEGGNDIRCGGWGHYFGDEGSGFWLGKKLCEIFSKMSDGRYEKGMLYDNVKRQLVLARDFDLIEIISNARDFRFEVAKLATLLIDSAIQGDHIALACVQEAAFELSLLVKGIMNIANFTKDTRIPVSYLGGIFKSGDLFLRCLQEHLQHYNISMYEPKLTPAQGACLYSYKKLNKDTDIFIKNLNKNNDR